MQDISVLVVKPEVIGRFDEVRTSTGKRGYISLFERKDSDWIERMREIYSPQFSKERISWLVDAYQSSGFGDEFGVLVLRHQRGNTLVELEAEQGHFIDYQTTSGTTLRHEFGMPARHNIPTPDSEFTVVFNAVHCPKTPEDLRRHLKILELQEFE